jgi:post-segregation antitoxin (ccd killing protein)
MARIADTEIARLKSDVSLVRLIEGAGHTLKPQGKDLAMRCPFHDGDDTPSFIVTPAKNVWHCFGCQSGGSVIDWVMRRDGVSFRGAVELLRHALGAAPRLTGAPAPSVSPLAAIESPPTSPHGPAAVTRRLLQSDARGIAGADDQALLNRVIDYYHATLKQSPEALAYLAQRGLDHPELIDRFRLGFANRTLGYHLPVMQTATGAALRGALQRIGLYRGTGHEHFNGSLVIPVLDGSEVREVYGRKITANLRPGTPVHLYLPGPHRGVFNEAGLVGQEEVILCEALIDALTFWCAGYRHVTASYGIEGFTEDILAALHRHTIKRVLIAYDRDAPGDTAAVRLAERLMAEGFECYRCLFPKGMDANAYALQVQPAVKSLGLVIRQAEWIGNGTAPARSPSDPVAAATVEATPVDVAQNIRVHNVDESSSLVAKAAAKEEALLVEPPVEPCDTVSLAQVVPPLPSPPIAQVTGGEVTVVLGDRRYRVRGLDKNLAYDVLKVNLLVARGPALHVDTFDLYQAKARALFARLASGELGVEESVIQRDLGQVLLTLEHQQEHVIQQQLGTAAHARVPSAPGPVMSSDDEAAALAFLRDPALIERIVADVERCGLVGEPTNALVGYLAALSRRLPQPLAILIQSTSAAGKSALMDAVLRLVPEDDRVHYSAMTGQSLFYLGEKDLKHKILAIAEEEGVRQAAYALKLLQSQGELTIASTGKDPATGKLVTEEYRVEGPVMLFLTTTAIDVDEELLNRCLVLTINESREQTRAIQQRQRERRTLAGLLADTDAEAITTLHRHAQQLLRPVAVVNPYADRLGFLDDRTRTRRDHQKYLTLIDAIAFLHQHQRPIRSVVHQGKTLDYLEVTPADIALANRLAHEVLGRSLDELPPQTRRLLGVIHAFVAEQCTAQGLRQSDVRFTRRELRERAGVSDTQLRLHLDRLIALEWVLPHRGQRGQTFVYELLFDGEVAQAAPRLPGLIEVELLETAATTTSSRGSDPEFTGASRPERGEFAAGSRGSTTPRDTTVNAVSSESAAVAVETERLRTRRNGTSHRSAGSLL